MVATMNTNDQHVTLIAKPGGTNTGVGRYAHMVYSGLQARGVAIQRVAPSPLPLPAAVYRWLKRIKIDLHTFSMNYPLWAKVPSSQTYHLTSQNLASMLAFKRPKGTIIITVHDIIPYLVRNNRKLTSYHTSIDRLFDRLAMLGLKRADHLIADSEYTKRCLIDELSIPSKRISVMHLGIDHTRFRQQPVPLSIRQRYHLPIGPKYLIYVGSEDPRKNLTTLFQALAQVRTIIPTIRLIKVGKAHFQQERQRLLDEARRLGISDTIQILDDVPEADLPYLYNIADVCVMPSLYEGFGFPVLEAMACGTIVVSSNIPSLMELTAGIAYYHNPYDVTTLAECIKRALESPNERQIMQQKGHKRAQSFDWVHVTEQIQTLYAILPTQAPFRPQEAA